MMKYHLLIEVCVLFLLNHITYVSTGEEPVRKASEEVCD